MKISESKIREIIRSELLSRKSSASLSEAYPTDPTGPQMDRIRKELVPWGTKPSSQAPDTEFFNAWKKFIKDTYEKITAGPGAVGTLGGPDIPNPVEVYNDWETAAPKLGWAPDTGGMIDFINAGGYPDAGSPAMAALTANITRLANQKITRAVGAVEVTMKAIENLADTGFGSSMTNRSAADAVWAFRNFNLHVAQVDDNDLVLTRTLLARYSIEKGGFSSPIVEWAGQAPASMAIIGAFLGIPALMGGVTAATAGGVAAVGVAAGIGGAWWAAYQKSNPDNAMIISAVGAMGSTTPDLVSDLGTWAKDVAKSSTDDEGYGTGLWRWMTGSAAPAVFGTSLNAMGDALGEAIRPAARKENVTAVLDAFLNDPALNGSNPVAMEAFKTGKLRAQALKESSERIIRKEIWGLLKEGTMGIPPADVDDQFRTYRDRAAPTVPPATGTPVPPPSGTTPTLPPTPPPGPTPPSGPTPPPPGPGPSRGKASVKELQAIVYGEWESGNTTAAAWPNPPIDGIWGTDTNAKFWSWTSGKLGAYAPPKSDVGIKGASWSRSGAAAASAVMGASYSPNASGALQFVKALLGVSSSPGTGAPPVTPPVGTRPVTKSKASRPAPKTMKRTLKFEPGDFKIVDDGGIGAPKLERLLNFLKSYGVVDRPGTVTINLPKKAGDKKIGFMSVREQPKDIFKMTDGSRKQVADHVTNAWNSLSDSERKAAVKQKVIIQIHDPAKDVRS